MMKEMPSVTSTWPWALPASGRRINRSSAMPTSADAKPGAERRQPEISADIATVAPK